MVVTSKVYTEALTNGIEISMNIFRWWDGYFTKQNLSVRFKKDYHQVGWLFDAEEYEKMISPEIAIESKLAEMKTEVMKPVRLWE
jgi:hypothetical protein